MNGGSWGAGFQLWMMRLSSRCGSHISIPGNMLNRRLRKQTRLPEVMIFQTRLHLQVYYADFIKTGHHMTHTCLVHPSSDWCGDWYIERLYICISASLFFGGGGCWFPWIMNVNSKIINKCQKKNIRSKMWRSASNHCWRIFKAWLRKGHLKSEIEFSIGALFDRINCKCIKPAWKGTKIRYDCLDSANNKGSTI